MTPEKDSSLTISERNWEILIIVSSSVISLLTFYCLLVGVTTVFTHLYYFPIILLAYRYQKKGVIYSLVLSTSYILMVFLLQYSNTVEICGALLRVLCFTGVAVVVAYLSIILSRKQQDFFNISLFNESIISNANVWLTVLDTQGNIVTWNRAAEDISGYSSEEVIGKNSIWKQLYPDSNYRKQITGIITTITREKQFFTNFETVIVTKDGGSKTISWNTRVIPHEQGVLDLFVAIGIDITEQKRAEDQLKESETFLNEVSEMALVGGWQLDTRTKAVHWTRETYRIHDIPFDKKFDLSKAILFFDLPGRSTLEAALQCCMEKGELFDLELPFTSAMGRKLWTRAMGRAIRVEGEIVKLEGTFQDITERKKAEDLLKKSQIKLAEAMDLANLVNWEFDVVSGIFTFNDQFYSLYGTTAEREGGYQMPAEVYAREFVPPDEAGLVATEVQKAINSTDPDYATKIEHRIIRRDGEIRNIIVRFAITKDEQGRTVKAHGANQDITERKKAENELKALYRELEDRVNERTSELLKTNDALKESSDRVQLLLNSTAEAIYGLDMQGLCTLCNTAFLRMLGYERTEQVIGRRIHDLIHHTHSDGTSCTFGDCRIFNAFLKGEGTHADNDIFWRADGTSFPVEFWSYPMRRDGNIIGVVVTFIDITERKQLEELNLKSLKEKEMLLKEIHHRVKNNMQVISSLLFMQERQVKDEKVRELLRESQNRIRSLALVHEELYRSANLDQIDYSAYLRKIVRQLSESYSVDPTIIRTEIISEKVFLNINKAVPCSLILNELISNAIKHAFPGGRKGIITIDFKFESGNNILIFSDDGIGIADTITFEWTESLGMQLIAGLVKQLNGSIVLDRKAGTKYTVTFP